MIFHEIPSFIAGGALPFDIVNSIQARYLEGKKSSCVFEEEPEAIREEVMSLLQRTVTFLRQLIPLWGKGRVARYAAILFSSIPPSDIPEVLRCTVDEEREKNRIEREKERELEGMQEQIGSRFLEYHRIRSSFFEQALFHTEYIGDSLSCGGPGLAGRKGRLLFENPLYSEIWKMYEALIDSFGSVFRSISTQRRNIDKHHAGKGFKDFSQGISRIDEELAHLRKLGEVFLQAEDEMAEGIPIPVYAEIYGEASGLEAISRELIRFFSQRNDDPEDVMYGELHDFFVDHNLHNQLHAFKEEDDDGIVEYPLRRTCRVEGFGDGSFIRIKY